MYVRDWIVISLRSAPREASGQVAQASTGERVEVLETSGDWARVRLASGAEGWTPVRFLSDRPPAALYAKQLEERVRELQAQIARLKGLPVPGEGAPEPLSYSTGGLAPDSLEGLASLRTEHEKLKAQYQACVESRDALNAEVSRLKNSERLFFTFVGGVFVVLGVIIGIFIQLAGPRSKRQGYRF